MNKPLLPVNTRKLQYTSFLICLLTSPLAISQSNEAKVKEGKILYKDKCARCHSKLIGRKITSSPKLTNLDKTYVIDRLTNYAKDSDDYTEESKYKQKMIDTAKSLSTSDINNLASFLSTR
jgi:cytochrome c553